MLDPLEERQIAEIREHGSPIERRVLDLEAEVRALNRILENRERTIVELRGRIPTIVFGSSEMSAITEAWK